jgi:hypothetical protein
MTMSAPALFWWHMKQDLSVADGVARARKIMAVVPAPAHKLPPGTKHEVSHDESWARLVTSTFQAFVVCRAVDDDILTVIMVAGQDGREAENTRNVLRDVMRSGNIAGLLE